MSALTHLVFAAMRNEGPFILEWVAWYRMLGFEVLVAHNDCTDHSPELLKCLADAGWINVVEHTPRSDQPPKNSAHAALKQHPMTQQADWLLVCDVDEFLVLKTGDGTIASYLEHMGHDALGIAFHWRCFGNSGWKRYRDGLTHRQFKRCGAPGLAVNGNIKTLVKNPKQFDRFTDHAPIQPALDWQAPEHRIINASGMAIEKFQTGRHPVRFTDKSLISHETAQMNHYVIRSDESFDLKRGTPSASAFKDRYTDQFYRARNRNGHKDDSALAYSAWFDAVWAEITAVPGVMRLHHLCCMDYIARLCAMHKRPAEDDERWQSHQSALDAI